MNINELIENEIENGYSNADAQAKVCQDIILKAISESSLSRNVTVKGGVVMRSKSGSLRRATQDLDIDFIKYSLTDEAVNDFINKLNCIDGLTITRVGEIKELKQQDYRGKRVYVEIRDEEGSAITNKLDIGVHNRLDIEQEEYCFEMDFDNEGASLLINSNEQMFTEKLKSLLRLGAITTRYKDVYDLYYLCGEVNRDKLKMCLAEYIYDDSQMKENDVRGVVRRVETVFNNSSFLMRLQSSYSNWIDEDVNKITDEIINFLKELESE